MDCFAESCFAALAETKLAKRGWESEGLVAEG